MLQKLKKIFDFQNGNFSTLKRFKKGDIFRLSSEVAIVVQGVVSVEIITHEEDFKSVPIRLAGAEDFLNVEIITSITCSQKQVMVVESDYVILSLFKADFLREQLNRENKDFVSGLIIRASTLEMMDTYYAVCCLNASNLEEKLILLLTRLMEIKQDSTLKISYERISKHIGVSAITVSREVKKIKVKGLLTKEMESLLNSSK